MKAKLLLILLALPCLCRAQTETIVETTDSDTSTYSLLADSVGRLTCGYPVYWQRFDNDKRLVFYVAEKLTDSADKVRESLVIMRYYNFGSLENSLKQLSRTIKNQSRKKIKVLGYELKVNKNGVEYGVLRNTFRDKHVYIIKHHVYFIRGRYKYGFTFEHEINKTATYQPIVNSIIDSITFYE